MLKKFLVIALFACFALNGIAQAEESATEKEKIQILDLYTTLTLIRRISVCSIIKTKNMALVLQCLKKITKNIKVKTRISYTLFAAMEEFFSLIVAHLSLKLKI